MAAYLHLGGLYLLGTVPPLQSHETWSPPIEGVNTSVWLSQISANVTVTTSLSPTATDCTNKRSLISCGSLIPASLLLDGNPENGNAEVAALLI